MTPEELSEGTIKDLYQFHRDELVKDLTAAVRKRWRECDLERQEELLLQPVLDLIELLSYSIYENYHGDTAAAEQFKRSVIFALVQSAEFKPRDIDRIFDLSRARDEEGRKPKRKAA